MTMNYFSVVFPKTWPATTKQFFFDGDDSQGRDLAYEQALRASHLGGGRVAICRRINDPRFEALPEIGEFLSPSTIKAVAVTAEQDVSDVVNYFITAPHAPEHRARRAKWMRMMESVEHALCCHGQAHLIRRDISRVVRQWVRARNQRRAA
jgi:hypothetical protein